LDNSVIRSVKKAVTNAIGEGFSYPIYAEDVVGKKKEDCFTVSTKKTEGKRLLGKRQEMRITFLVTYIPQLPFLQEKIEEISLELQEVLAEVHWEGEGFLASKMEEKIEDGRLFVYATYYFQVFAEENQEKMAFLEQRRGFCGESNI